MKKIIYICMLAAILAVGCDKSTDNSNIKSTSGVSKVDVTVDTMANGMTVEQQNIADRLQMDNSPGSIKHLYIFSAFSGDTLLYSTVRGKVTSSGKRLSPTSVAATDGRAVGSQFNGFAVSIGGETFRTSEVLQDDGTYGSSIEYLFWFDERGNYHQHYITGGQILHVSNVPIRVRKPIVNIELTTTTEKTPTKAISPGPIPIDSVH